MKNITPAEVLPLLRQLSRLISAGISLMKSFAIIMQTSETKELYHLIATLRLDLESGKGLSQGLERYPRLFDTFSCQLIRIGEQTGTLERSLQWLVLYKEKNQVLIKQLKQALLYPTLILVTALFTTLFLLLFVVPQFASLFAHLSNKLPWSTRMLIQLAFCLRTWMPWFILLFILILLYLFRFSETIHLKDHFQRLVLKLSPLRKLVLRMILSRFSRALSIMLTAGLPLTEALLLAAPLSSFKEFRNSVLSIHAGVHAGNLFSAHLKPPFFIFPLLAQMARIGEESGSLDQMLEKFADLQEAELDQQLKTLQLLLEPLIIAILGVLIGGGR